jgi:hypothetical protein
MFTVSAGLGSRQLRSDLSGERWLVAEKKADREDAVVTDGGEDDVGGSDLGGRITDNISVDALNDLTPIHC